MKKIVSCFMDHYFLLDYGLPNGLSVFRKSCYETSYLLICTLLPKKIKILCFHNFEVDLK